MSLLDKGLGIVRLGQIGRYRDDFPICLACDLGRCRLQRFFSARTNCDIDTLPSQCKGYRLADPGAPSGDKRRFPVHLEIHQDSRGLKAVMKAC